MDSGGPEHEKGSQRRRMYCPLIALEWAHDDDDDGARRPRCQLTGDGVAFWCSVAHAKRQAFILLTIKERLNRSRVRYICRALGRRETRLASVVSVWPLEQEKISVIRKCLPFPSPPNPLSIRSFPFRQRRHHDRNQKLVNFKSYIASRPWEDRNGFFLRVIIGLCCS